MKAIQIPILGAVQLEELDKLYNDTRDTDNLHVLKQKVNYCTNGFERVH